MQVVFNYLFSNGDAHLKNFALLETESGDHFLSPAYDLMNTGMHVPDTNFGLDKGLFADTFRSPAYMRNHHPGLEDFTVLAGRIGIEANRAHNLLTSFLAKQEKLAQLIEHSFLDDASKKAYLLAYNTRKNFLGKE
jgi:serine/threonine-protein kinase HipA